MHPLTLSTLFGAVLRTACPDVTGRIPPLPTLL